MSTVMAATQVDPVVTFPCAISGCGNRLVKRGHVCTESTGVERQAVSAATAEQNAAYRTGRCVGLCGRRYVIGPRCTDCHANRITSQMDGDT